MKLQTSSLIRGLAMLVVFPALICAVALAQDTSFHNAPASAKQAKNPYSGDNLAGISFTRRSA